MASPSRLQSRILTRGTRFLSAAVATRTTKPLKREGDEKNVFTYRFSHAFLQPRQRDLARQVKADPLASIPSHLKGSPSRAQARSHSQLQRPPSSASREGRLVRESAERERALALVRRKQRERAESATATPSTVRGGDGGPGYADVFNRREVEDAHRERDRVWRQRRWEDDDRDDGRQRRR
jgi:hypothetical protein